MPPIFDHPVAEPRGAAGGRSSNIIIIISVRRERPTPPSSVRFRSGRWRTTPYLLRSPGAADRSIAAGAAATTPAFRPERPSSIVRREPQIAKMESATAATSLGSRGAASLCLAERGARLRSASRARDVCAITVYAALAHPQNQLSICRTYLSSSSRRTVGANGQAGSSNGAYRVH